MNENKSARLLIILILLLIPLAGCADLLGNGPADTLEASGTVETVEVLVAPELSGRVAEVYVAKGDAVEAGDPLFRISDDLQAEQRVQAVAALEAAEAGVQSAQAAVAAAESGSGPAAAALAAAQAAVVSANAYVDAANAALETAQAGLDGADVQHQMVVAGARLLDEPNRANAWNQALPEVFTLPAWYLQKSEEIQAAEAEVASAEAALIVEQENLATLLAEPRFQNLLAAETRLAEAQAAYLVAEDLVNREISGNQDLSGEAGDNGAGDTAIPVPEDVTGSVSDNVNNSVADSVGEYTQELYDTALAELEAAQAAMDQILTDQASADVLEARGRLAGATGRLAIAQSRLNSLLTGDESLEVLASEIALRQAETLVGQAEAQVAQAEAGVEQAQTGVTAVEVNQGLVQIQVDQAQAGVVQAEKIVDQAQAALDLLDAQAEKLTVYAAVPGVILERHVEPGEVVGPGVGVMTIGQLADLTVVVFVPENRYGQVKLGDRVTLTTDSFPDETINGVVVRISDRAEFTPRNVQTAEERQTTVYAIEVAVEGGNGQLKPGMPVTVNFQP